MNRITKHIASHASTVSKVRISDEPQAPEVSEALTQLPRDKKLYVRSDSAGNKILTTKAPRWYKFSAKKEQLSAQEMLSKVLDKRTLIPSTNDQCMQALRALKLDTRNTAQLRSANAALANYARSMGAGSK